MIAKNRWMSEASHAMGDPEQKATQVFFSCFTLILFSSLSCFPPSLSQGGRGGGLGKGGGACVHAGRVSTNEGKKWAGLVDYAPPLNALRDVLISEGVTLTLPSFCNIFLRPLRRPLKVLSLP